MRTVVLVLALASCGPSWPTGPGIAGSRADVHTQPGTYAGYAVAYPCSGHFVDIGLRGLGSHELDQVADIEAAGEDILASLRDIPSVWGGGGYGLECEPGVGTQIFLDDWRDVDRVIGRVGQLLADRDLALQVGISVSSIPVPDSN